MKIHVLDAETIDKIAAGEVVERPRSVVKELVENAMDAGADRITVEIKDGGISYIRITDNGSGIAKDDIKVAFLRHATSKIEKADDLFRISSLGFRGEALSSICAVAKVELITKTKESLTGIRYCIEGGVEKEYAEVGAPNGTTILVRNLFYNVPVRQKFLKQPSTEGSYIVDLMEHLALSKPDIAFKLTVNGQVKFHTSGNGDLAEVLYRIYGRDVAQNVIPIHAEGEGISVSGYLGKPVLNRSTRNFEVYFINHRYVQSKIIAKAIEDGYSAYLMQHKFPFAVLHFTVDYDLVDVNVHPSKTEVRFLNGNVFYAFIAREIEAVLKRQEMIPEESTGDEKNKKPQKISVPEPFEEKRTKEFLQEEKSRIAELFPKVQKYLVREDTPYLKENASLRESAPLQETASFRENAPSQDNAFLQDSEPVPKQLSFLDEKLLSESAAENYRILGQIFDTYWLVVFADKLYLIDQHAAHEKVKYERLIAAYRQKSITSQYLNPPIVVSLTAKEEQVYQENAAYFASLGFEIEPFGGREYALRAIPSDLYGLRETAILKEILDELMEGPVYKELNLVEEKLASMACKAAVKGNHKMSDAEVRALIGELLTLENPYNCPHGRPTIISVSKYEIEKKFKRIV